MLPMGEFSKKHDDVSEYRSTEAKLVERYFFFKDMLDRNNAYLNEHVKKWHIVEGTLVLPTTCHQCNGYRGLIASADRKLRNIEKQLLELGIDTSQLHNTSSTSTQR